MRAYPAYTLDDILHLTVRNYVALRATIPALRNRDIANMIRAYNFAQSKDVAKIVSTYDPPKGKTH